MKDKYDVIYADPPWRYSFSKSKSRKIEKQYETMTLDDIKAYPINSADNSVLFLWATAPKLLEAIAVMAAWGFKYKTCAVWDKGKIGMGYWFRGQHELLLVGTKGKFSPPQPCDRVSSVLSYARGKHSAKPPEVRDLIKKSFPGANRVELFARERVYGWSSEGFEVE